MTWRDAALAALLGTTCVGCQRPGRPWCPGCSAEVAHLVDPVVLPGSPSLIVCAPYTGVLPAAVVGYKDRGVGALRADLAGVLAAGLLTAIDLVGPALVAPAPSAPTAVRRRGFDHMHDVARSACDLTGLSCARLLRTHRRRDQAGLRYSDRRRNVRGTTVRTPGSGPVIVVDDVRTSGATLADSVRALTDGGYTPSAQVVIAAGIADPACGDDHERVSVNCSTPGRTEQGGLS